MKHGKQIILWNDADSEEELIVSTGDKPKLHNFD